MCGIAGIIHPSHKSLIQAMTAVIAHRGPDDFGYHSGDNISLGHRRLAIQDLSANGHQPMFTTDGRLGIVFNGEIYNHWEIRKNLETKYTFKSTSDTETILYGFQEYGVDIFNQLNGIFALCILDTHSGQLTIARDQFGVKPLYYVHNNQCLAFASEIKSLQQLPNIDLSIDENSLANYLYFLWSPGENTPFEHIKKLQAGHYLQGYANDIHSFTIAKYYELPFHGKYIYKSENEWIDIIDHALQKAVERQLLSDVPVGFFLSGGLDSSLIVAIAKKLYPEKKFNCYTIESLIESKKEGFTDDLPYAKKVADYLDLPLTVVKADVDIVRDFDKMIYHLDEPQADAAPLNVWNICKLAREKGDIVLLGGTGGDDLFSGYRRHQWLYLDHKMKLLPSFVKTFIKFLSNFMPDNAAKRRVQKFFTIYDHSNKQNQMASLYGWLEVSEVKKLFRKDLLHFNPISFLKNSLASIPDEKDPLNQMLFWELKYFLTDHNLNYTDKMSMAHGIEVRVPYLDKELVDLSCKIPQNLKMKGLETKYILKKVAERYLPQDVIYRSKTGFGAPVRDWITSDLSEMISRYLSKDQVEKRGIFDYEAIRKLIKENQSGKIDASYSIWCLLAIESWMRQFVDKNP
jgi:asparagine synthase (glutamine-hydrolysing)